MNSPFFAGYDWSAMTTENIERIEIVRGPFSALYGSDAIGGVVQVFTRPARRGLSGRATGEAGNEGQGQGSAFVSAGQERSARHGELSVRGIRRRPPNTDWRQRNSSAQPPGAALRVGSRIAVEGGLLDGEVGFPGPVGAPSSARGRLREERLAIPGSFRPLRHEPPRRAARWRPLEPAFRDTAGGFESETDAETLQARVSDTAASRSARADGVRVLGALDRRRRQQLRGRTWTIARTTLWGSGAQDTVDLRSFHGRRRAALRPPLDFRRRLEPAGNDLVALRRLALEVAGFRRARVSRAHGWRALLPVLRQPRPSARAVDFLGSSAPSATSEAAPRRSRSSGTTSRTSSSSTSRRPTNLNIGRARTRGVELGWRQAILPSSRPTLPTRISTPRTWSPALRCSAGPATAPPSGWTGSRSPASTSCRASCTSGRARTTIA